MTDVPTPAVSGLSRCKRGCAYTVYLAAAAAVLLFVLDRAIGLFLPPPDFPPNGLANPPLEDKTVAYIDFEYTSSTNSMGLRDVEFPPESAHDFRIVAVGDSYTFGMGVDLEDAWIKQLEGLLRARGLDVEIVNVGQPGVGPIEYVRNARAALARLNPDMVLIGLLQGNDLFQCTVPLPFVWLDTLWPNLMRLTFEWPVLWAGGPAQPPERSVQTKEEHREYLQQEALRMLAEMTPAMRTRYDQLDQQIRDLFLGGQINPWMIVEAVGGEVRFEDILDLDSPQISRKIKVLAHLLGCIKSRAEATGACVVVVSVPNGVYDNEHIYAFLERLGYGVSRGIMGSDAPDRAARMACDAAGVPFVEGTSVFHDRSDDPSLYFQFDHHLTAKGHRLLAENVAPFVEEAVKNRMRETGQWPPAGAS